MSFWKLLERHTPWSYKAWISPGGIFGSVAPGFDTKSLVHIERIHCFFSFRRSELVHLIPSPRNYAFEPSQVDLSIVHDAHHMAPSCTYKRPLYRSAKKTLRLYERSVSSSIQKRRVVGWCPDACAWSCTWITKLLFQWKE